MKKKIITLLIGFMLTGCSANNSKQVVDKNKANVTEIKEAVATLNVASEKQNFVDGQMSEIHIPDTGLSLEIPNTWNPNKYKIYKENSSIMVDYTGEKEMPFFDITVIGKKGIETPDVGLKMEVKTIDDWVMMISYGYELAYAQIDEVRNNNPSEYNDMADSVQKIISSLKIVDKSKLERWFNESNIKEPVPQQTTNTPAVEKQPEYKKYSDFLGMDDKVQKYIKDDIDLDGKQEIVIVFDGDSRQKTYVLREYGDTIQKIGQIDEAGYGISEVELIKLKGEKKKYIKTNLTNWANLSGFALYEVDKNTINLITYSASATGVGDDHLVDRDEDGYYEGFIQNRFSYDVLHYYVSRYFYWNGRDFTLHSTSINLDDYPENPEKVVSQFLKLSILNNYEENCAELSKRLRELNISNKKLSFEKEDAWFEALQLENLDYDVKENGNSTTVAVTMNDENIGFKLTKANDKWHISDFNGANVIGSAN